MMIRNLGADIPETDYWTTEHARRGLIYLSGNAGVWRLLVPAAAEHLLAEMRTGKSVTIERSPQDPAAAVDIVFDDRSSTPFSATIDRRQIDRPISPASTSLCIWTQRGKEFCLPCIVGG